MDQLLTPQELAEYLRLNQTTVIRKVNCGEIPAIKIGKQFRFNKDQIDRWLLQQTVGRATQILVVDDEPVILRFFQDSLAKSGSNVRTTSNSPEALELLSREHFDLIFLDLVMPEIDGSDLFRHIRKRDKQVPVVIISGYPDSDLLKKAKEYGPFTIMIKPFTSEDILQAVRTFRHQTTDGRKQTAKKK